jgi:DNA-binding NarL/FixJ family response regulator
MEILSPAARRYVGRYPGTMPPSYSLSLSGTPARIKESKRVLVIDDDPFFRSLLKVMLRQCLAGIEIEEAGESRTAFAICQERDLDLVFCDLNLPAAMSKNGIDLVHDIRSLRPNLPVYMVTSDDTSDVVEKVCSAGAMGHILKPVNLRILRRVIASSLR